MPTDFYTQWLMVPPGPRPPNHYALLGVPPFAATAQEIEAAAGRQLERLDRYALHPDKETRDACQHLMNEVARARVTLVSPEKRAAYDDQLMTAGAPGADTGPDAVPGISGSALTRLATREHGSPASDVEVGAGESTESVEVPPLAVPELAGAETPAGPGPAAPDVAQDLASTAQAEQYRWRRKRRNSNVGIAVLAAAVIICFVLAFLGVQYFRAMRQADLADAKPKPGPDHTATTAPASHPKPIATGTTRPGPTTHPAPVVIATTHPAPVATTQIAVGPKPPTTAPAATQVAATLPAGAEPKLPLPDAARQTRAVAQVNDLFKDAMANCNTAQDALALAGKLLQAGVADKDPVRRSALFTRSMTFAIKAGSPDAAFAALDQMDKHYQIDALRLKAEALVSLAAGATTPADESTVNSTLIPTCDRTIQEGRYDLARQLVDAGLRAARDANDAPAGKQLVERALEVRTAAAAFTLAKAAAPTLSTNPTDPDANLTVGLFVSVWKGDWTTGLSLLALGGDAALRELAQAELRPGPDAQALVAIGDGWWNYAARQSSIVRQRMRAHAAALYGKAIPSLSGLTRERIERRLAVVDQMALAGTPAAAGTSAARGVPSLAGGGAGAIVPVSQPGVNLWPVPSAAAQDAAMEQVKQLAAKVTADALAAGAAATRGQLIGALFTKSTFVAIDDQATPTDRALRYMLTLESLRLASETGNIGEICNLAETLGRRYAVDVLDLKFQGMDDAGTGGDRGGRLRTFVDAAVELRDEALERRRYTLAGKFAALAESLAQRSADPSLAAAVHFGNARLQDWPAVQTALSTLEAKPDDADANFRVGRFACMVGGDWNEGLKYLALGSDARMKALASAELAKPVTAEEQKALADGWWDIVTTDATARMHLEFHADALYARALPGLSAAAQAAAVARINSLAKYRNDLPPIGAVPDDPRMPAAKAILLATLPTNDAPGAYSAAFSDDGRRIVGLGPQAFHVWDSATGAVVGHPVPLAPPPAGVVSRAAFFDNSVSRVVAVGPRADTITVWDIATQQQDGATITKAGITDADISPDGHFVVTANADFTATLWELQTGRPIVAMAHKNRITNVRYSADGKFVVTTSFDRTCCVWNASTGASVSQYGPAPGPPTGGDWFVASTFDPAAKKVATLFHDGHIALWDAATGKDIPMSTGTTGSAIAFSPNGLYLAAGGTFPYRYSHAQDSWSAAQVFDTATGTSLTNLLKHDGGERSNGADPGMTLAFSHDNHYLVTSTGYGKTVRVWDLQKGGALAVMPLEHLQPVSSAAFDQGARHIITACTDGTIRVWQLPS